jgi:hypothetical protein
MVMTEMKKGKRRGGTYTHKIRRRVWKRFPMKEKEMKEAAT